MARPVPSAADLRARIARLSPREQARLITALTDADAKTLEADWGLWAHDGQLAPAGEDWRTWVIMAGRGFGKTRAGAEWVRGIVDAHPGARIALVAASLQEARAIMVEGRSGLIAIAGDRIAVYLSSERRLVFTNGAEAMLFSGASPERLRGPEHHFAWCDELAKWRRAGDSWDMLQLGLRLGDRPRALVTTTPRAGAVLTRIMRQRGTVKTGGATMANPHLPPAFVDAVREQYEGTRLGRQELEGELLSDLPGALWTVELLERCRVQFLPGTEQSRSSRAKSRGAGTGSEPRPSTSLGTSELQNHMKIARTLVGVDPPSGDGTCGIVACARDAAGRGHVLADHSVTALSPEGWARAVADAVTIHGAEGVVAEGNQGGKMVAAVLRIADPRLRVKMVTASVGKSLRAEPVARLFEAGKVTLHGRFPELESELIGMIAGGGYDGPGTSPDRADAMVWALTELMLGHDRVPRVVAF